MADSGAGAAEASEATCQSRVPSRVEETGKRGGVWAGGRSFPQSPSCASPRLLRPSKASLVSAQLPLLVPSQGSLLWVSRATGRAGGGDDGTGSPEGGVFSRQPRCVRPPAVGQQVFATVELGGLETWRAGGLILGEWRPSPLPAATSGSGEHLVCPAVCSDAGEGKGASWKWWACLGGRGREVTQCALCLPAPRAPREKEGGWLGFAVSTIAPPRFMELLSLLHHPLRSAGRSSPSSAGAKPVSSGLASPVGGPWEGSIRIGAAVTPPPLPPLECPFPGPEDAFALGDLPR